MKNLPKKIYLQVGEKCDKDADFNELKGITWSTKRIFKNDLIFYLSKNEQEKELDTLETKKIEMTDEDKKELEELFYSWEFGHVDGHEWMMDDSSLEMLWKWINNKIHTKLGGLE